MLLGQLTDLALFSDLQVKADFEAGPERPSTPRGSQAEKAPVFNGKASDAVLIPGARLL